MPKSYYMKNWLWLLKPYRRYAKKYFIFSLVFFGILVPFLNFCDVIFPEFIISSIDTKSPVVKIIIGIIGFQLIDFLIPAIEDLYNIYFKDVSEVLVEANINREIYEFSTKVDYCHLDKSEFYENYTWAIEHTAEQSSKAFSVLTRCIASIGQILSLAVLLFTINPIILVLILIGTILRTYGYFKYNEFYIERQKKVVHTNRKFSYIQRLFYLKEYSADIRTTRLKDIILKQYDRNTSQQESYMKDYAKSLCKWAIFSGFAYHFMMLLSMLFLLKSIMDNSLLASAVWITAILSINKISDCLTELFDQVKDIHQIDIYAKRIQEFYQLKPVIEDCVGSTVQIPYEITFHNVKFEYDKGKPVLNNVNIHINAGEKIAIVGKNGVGKSTLIKLLLRLYDPTDGYIKVNGIDIKKYDTKEYRKYIGTVFQDSNIYAFSIKDNLDIYSEHQKDGISFTIDKVHLTQQLKNHENELTKEFSDNGIVLSGGEMQKLAIARILDGEFGLILFDEPSSALDPIAEEQVMKLIYSMASTTTTIVIAHRLSSIRDMDRILVVDNGRIIEEGNHNHLMNRKGLYYQMWNTQAEKYK